MLEIMDLSAENGSFSLKNINLTLDKKVCHVIVGENGSGKTTFLECLLGFRKIKSGRIMLNGKDITNTEVEQRGFAYLPQDLVLFPNMTVEENIYFVKKLNPLSSLPLEMIKDMFEEFRIENLLRCKVNKLSGGERQKVAILRAIASGRKYILMDEPFSSLDLSTKTNLWKMLKDFKSRFNLTILLVTHDMNEAYFLGDSMSLMSNGQMYGLERNKLVFFNKFISRIENEEGFDKISKIFRIDPKLLQSVS